jgi:ABC-type glycerol-3-phosphate transport system permease component
MVSPCGVWQILTFTHLLLLLLIWLCCLVSYYHLFLSSIKSSSVLSSTFLCHHMLFHYLKLKPSWLKREAAWVAYSTLISHICTHVTIVAIVVWYCIIISFFWSCHPTCYHHFLFCAIACYLNLKLKSSSLRHEAAHWVASSPLLSSWSYNPFPYPLNLKPISYPILIVVLLLLLQC